ncbi:CHAP domain-containing protein [Bifidobacterium sp. ESL0763]|uniref:CHAP domain-containing protein n=1 Tax=Bifidobacterium sp. ESL0763 TaxID=2983227 RepID=UPI0023F9A1AC|nr:CHAP domain-containing protein [Bifidobacterium sp. ESL0763]MDF7663588.1 CHAP domain-containing protein [Bifidobacterium sp. ESL0763]
MLKQKWISAASSMLLATATVCGAAAMSMTASVPQAQASTQSDYQQASATEADLKSQLAGVDSDLANQILELNDLTNNKIPAAQAAAQNAQQGADQAKSLAQATSDRLAAAQKDKSDLEAKIKKTGVDFDDAKAGVAAQARESFHGSHAADVMDVVTKSGTTKDFVDKMQSSAAVTRSEANAADADANTLGTSMNRKQRLNAIETQISKLKDQADSQAASAQQAAESAQAQQSSLQALRDQGAQARASLEAQKSSLTTQSSQQAAQLAILQSQVDAENEQFGNQQADPTQGTSQQGSAGNVQSNPSPVAAAPSPVYGGGGHPSGDSGNAYPPRQCTEWAYLRRHQLGLPVGSYFGNGGSWANSARALGYQVDRTPSYGAIVVFYPGQSVGGHWIADPYYGHVAIVEGVWGNTIAISEGGTGFATFPANEVLNDAYNYEYIHN